MKQLRVMVLAVCFAAGVLPAVPAGAHGAQAVPTPGPGVCQGRAIMLNEGETFEERTLYFRGSAPIGPLDALEGGESLALSPDEPTSTADKVYPALLGNNNYNRNGPNGYWWRQQQIAERIVCAEAKVFAYQRGPGRLDVQLWVDQPQGTGATVTREATGTAPADEISEYDVNFGQLDVTAIDNIVVQMASQFTVVFYDSTARPSQFNYVVVVPPQ